MSVPTTASISPAKKAEVEAVKKKFEDSVAAVFVDFRGVNVELTTELRSRFRAKGIDYKVVKNTLIKKALEGTDLADNEIVQHLKGPTAIAFSFEDPSAAAKVIKDFRKEGEEQEKLTVKCGLLNSEFLDAKRVENELASLPGKDELRGMLLAQLMAPGQSLVRQLHAAGQNFAYVLDAYVRKNS